MMPISPRCPNVLGFTLVELLVVLTIMGLLATLVVPRMGRQPAAIARRQLSAQLSGIFTAARARARMSGVSQVIDQAAFPDICRWAANHDGTSASFNDLTFFPDGSASGGIILCNNRAVQRIDWLTGMASNVG